MNPSKYTISYAFLATLGLVSIAGCASFSASVGDERPAQGGEAEAEASPGSPASPASPASPGPATVEPGGPFVSLHVRGSQTPVTHAAGTSGQTPTKQRLAFKSLTLFATREDAAADRGGYAVYDLGAKPVEAGVGQGEDTVITKLPIRSLRAGHYAAARVRVAYVRYAVRSTLHSLGYAVPGEYENVQVLASDTLLDGQLRQRGYYRYTFRSPLTAPVSVEGTDAPVPLTTGLGGISLETGAEGLTYLVPVDLTIDTAVSYDLHAIYEVNTHESFRWRDEAAPGYAAGVYDTTPTSFEPVVSFGANSARLYWEQ